MKLRSEDMDDYLASDSNKENIGMSDEPISDTVPLGSESGEQLASSSGYDSSESSLIKPPALINTNSEHL
jgi:hypothetical protein